MKSYRFESYIWITAESEAQARERLKLLFESSPPEWEMADVTDVEDVAEGGYLCPSCNVYHILGFVCEEQAR